MPCAEDAAARGVGGQPTQLEYSFPLVCVRTNAFSLLWRLEAGSSVFLSGAATAVRYTPHRRPSRAGIPRGRNSQAASNLSLGKNHPHG